MSKIRTKTCISLCLDLREDEDILRWLECQENMSASVRAAIREYVANRGATINDVYDVVKSIERIISEGVVLSSGEPNGDNGDVVDVSDALGALLE